jgi:ABC-type metal ion transport system, periplasmic component/surface adhesin
MKPNIAIKMISVLLSVTIIAIMFSGCSQSKTENKNKKISIVATIFPQYDFARRIAGDRAGITMLLKPGMEAHTYEPSPKDIIGISQCDLFLNVGGESESWLSSVLESADNPSMKIVSALDCVEAIEEETAEGMQSRGHHHEHEHEEQEHASDSDRHHDECEEEEEEYDEHVWTSPMNAIAIVNEINKALCEIDPANADFYCHNTNEYVAELLELDNSFRDVISQSKRHLLVFGDRFPLLYFVRAYGLEYYAAFPGCAAETEPSAATVAFLINTVKREKVPVVLYIELSNHRVADAIAEATGTRTAQFNTCHNISAKDFEAGESYLSLMRANVGILREVLN